MTIDPKSIATKDLHQFILASVAPRPIAFASTISDDGVPNLAPYSFFNAFSSNPPILVFSSNRRGEDNTTKDTLHNIRQNAEVVINVVNYPIVRQMAIASGDYTSDISEFEKAGLTPVPSTAVKPFRVKESPVNIECRVKDIIPLGDQGGAGHLIICDVLLLHIDDAVIDERNRIDPNKIDLVGRMGRMNYVRASGDAIFEIMQPYKPVGVGFDQLPNGIRRSDVLTGNDLAQIAGLPSLPNKEEVENLLSEDAVLKNIHQTHANNPAALKKHLHQRAQELIASGEVLQAAMVLLSEEGRE